MKNERAVIDEEFRRLSEFRHMSTGQPLPSPEWHAWPTAVNSDATFRSLVTEIYKAWYELWSGDVAFLTGLHPRAVLAGRFQHTIKSLRTAYQHATKSPEDVKKLIAWLRRANGGLDPADAAAWITCGNQLATVLGEALAELADIAGGASRDPDQQRSWRQHAEVTVSAIVELVAVDLDLRLGPGRRDYVERAVQKRFERWSRRPSGDLQAMMLSFAEEELISGAGPLPCGYQVVLEELDLFGSRHAVAALRLAHAIAEISGADEARFRCLLVQTWEELRKDA